MKPLTRFCRVIVGIVFIFSGFVKLLAPVGTSLIMKEYLELFHLGFISGGALPLGIALAMMEFLTGVSLLLRLRIRLFAWVALILLAIFTPLTLYLALFNPIADCGCFGEAVHLSNWQTFLKNVILLPLAVILFIFRRKVAPSGSAFGEWVFVLLFAALGLWLPVRTMTVAPLQEFTPYKVGSEVTAGTKVSEMPEYETLFVYEKEGEVRRFTLDDLPDSTWTYVDTETTQLSGGGVQASDADFVIESPGGANITESILSRRNLLLMTIYHPDKFFRRHTADDIAGVCERAAGEGMYLMVAAPYPLENLPEGCEMALADPKLLQTFNRSNGGVTRLESGLIVRKWARPAALSGAVFNPAGSPERESISTLNRQRLLLESFIGVFLLLCIIKGLVFRKKKQ